MNQGYFVVVLAHSIQGRLRRIHIPHQAVYVILLLAVLGSVSVFGFVASYARMAWKVANYNSLRKEAENIRLRYQDLQKKVTEKAARARTLPSHRIVRCVGRKACRSTFAVSCARSRACREEPGVKLSPPRGFVHRGVMLYMVIERFKNRDAKAIYARLNDKGRMMPQGLVYVSSWIDTSFDRCFQVMQCDDEALLREWASHWSDLMDFEFVPVRTSDQARAVALGAS